MHISCRLSVKTILNRNSCVGGLKLGEEHPNSAIKGRNPFFLEPAIIIAITDGSKLTTNSGVQEELHLPLMSPLPGSELTKEPFRWDQRLFALVLRIPGATSVEQEQVTAVQLDDSSITPMCDVTGGGEEGAKMECDRVISSIGKKCPQETGIKVRNGKTLPSLAARKDFKELLQEITGEVPQRQSDVNVKEFPGFQIALLNKDLKPQTFRNAYDISRSSLLDHLTRMRTNLLKSTRKFFSVQDEDHLHSVPIVQMGNYQEYLRNIPSPLRELDADQPKRLHTFGNPFKLDKKGMMIDEADEFVSGHQSKHKRPGEPSMSGIPKRRRCMSPLLRSRPASPVVNNHIGGKSPPSVTQGSSDSPKTEDEHKHPVINNNLTDAVENHVEDQLAPDLFMDTSEQFETLSQVSLNSLESADDSADDGDSDSFTNKTERFIENPKPSENLGNCFVNDTTALSLKMRRLRPCRSYEEVNTELKIRIMKEIRKPGRKYEPIFALLQEVQGSLQTRLFFLQNVIKEAARFKKRMLIEQLEIFLEEIHRRSNQLNHFSDC
ncbi:hypothetical protein AB205_0066330 [Aquarana catesbeiana]|uniref:INTS6/SAGE1/DDX26B/CT45 C-terminal domain-containing protein n=1 Tax=Aquarana catesbeiana TaxID=8400 RepID=A0A2G9SCQ4_AQUCT|nr:hypothetical protein AB205_0066330 [Aquarana catesbeiana]